MLLAGALLSVTRPSGRMTKINRKIQERLRAGLRCFKPLLKAAKERDASRADTATLALDLLSDLFGFDRYSVR